MKELPCKDCKWYNESQGICTHKDGAQLEKEGLRGMANCNQFEFK